MFQQNEGQIVFPANRTLNYTSNTNCEWTIEVSPNFAILAFFDEINIEDDKKCYNDHIQFHDGKDSSAPVITRTCGTKNIVVKTTGFYLTVAFHSDENHQHEGFKMNWTLTQGLEKRTISLFLLTRLN